MKNLKDLFFLIIAWPVYFIFLLLTHHFIPFNPVYFKWIGLLVGIIFSFFNMYIWFFRDYEMDCRDKYSGGAAGGAAIGCIGFLFFPLIGFLSGIIIKHIIT
jgi:hypothetical protein